MYLVIYRCRWLLIDLEYGCMRSLFRPAAETGDRPNAIIEMLVIDVSPLLWIIWSGMDTMVYMLRMVCASYGGRLTFGGTTGRHKVRNVHLWGWGHFTSGPPYFMRGISWLVISDTSRVNNSSQLKSPSNKPSLRLWASLHFSHRRDAESDISALSNSSAGLCHCHITYAIRIPSDCSPPLCSSSYILDFTHACWPYIAAVRIKSLIISCFDLLQIKMASIMRIRGHELWWVRRLIFEIVFFSSTSLCGSGGTTKHWVSRWRESRLAKPWRNVSKVSRVDMLHYFVMQIKELSEELYNECVEKQYIAMMYQH